VLDAVNVNNNKQLLQGQSFNGGAYKLKQPIFCKQSIIEY